MARLEDTLALRLGWEPEGRVRFACAGCGVGYSSPVADVVWMLNSLGLGGESSLFEDAAKLATQPCVRCGAVRWVSRPAGSAGLRPR